MTAFSLAWAAAYEALPPNSEDARLGASRIRELKRDIRERLAVDHSLVGDENDGQHLQVTLIKRVTDPTTGADIGYIYSKLVGTVTELFFKSSNGNITQLTNSTSPNSTVIVPGTILPYALGGAINPNTGYLSCDGAAVSRVTYAALFTYIGTTWGPGDSINTFNVPDLRGRGLIGAGTGTGLTARVVGQTMGEESHVLLAAELPNPAYTVKVLVGSIGAAGGLAAQGVSTTDGTLALSIPGNNTPHNNMQPSAVITWVIKY